MTWIKICGITNLEDALKTSSLGVDALGFIFAPSRRRVEPSMAKKIIRPLPKTLLKVGVFVDEDPEEVMRTVEYCGLNALQFHGKEPPEYCQKFFHPVLKTIRIKNLDSLREIENYRNVTILLDSYSPHQAGGTGIPFPWEIALKAKESGDFILSGGLNPNNVREAILKVKPLGLDVCSGVEVHPGNKDPLKIKKFIKEVRNADESAK
ncbi:MAG: phosphoribosylanthranilate isomerase [Deltaproteobacteria bacterium]|nr:phosphoribosylanthranilate isomerase [Deltaproteobacteria bacterium]